ncbi:spermatogenesis-associated protein 31A6-like [Thomomys bottae]
MMKSLGRAQDAAIPQAFWNTKGESQQLPESPELLLPMVLQKCSQLFWGLPFLHSESLVAPVQMSGQPLVLPSVLFNTFYNFMPAQDQDNVLPQHFPPQPLLQHFSQSQNYTPALTWPQPLPLADSQAQAHVPSYMPVLSSHSPPVNSCTVPPVVQHLEHHLARKHLESQRILPAVVNQSLKAFTQDQGHLHQREFIKIPGEFISFEMRKKLENHLQERLIQHLHKRNCEIQVFSGKKSRVTDQAEDKPGCSQNSRNVDVCCRRQERGTSESSASQQWGNSRKDLEHHSTGVATQLDRDAESSSADGVQANTLRELENDVMRSSHSDSQYFPPIYSGMNSLGEALRAHLIKKWDQINRDKVPLHVSHSRGSTDHALAPLENSSSSITGTEASLDTRESCTSSSQKAFLLDAATQQLLEAHIKKHWVKHKWGLSLKILKPINHLTLKKALPVAISQEASPHLACCDFRANLTSKGDAFQEEALDKLPKMPGREKSGHTTQPPQAPPRETLSRTLGSHHCDPSVVSPPGEKEGLLSNSKTCSLLGSTWHQDIVPGSEGSSPETNTSPIMGICETQEKESLCHGMSIREIFASDMTEDPIEMAEVEERQPTNWSVNKDLQNLNLLEFLRTTRTPLPSRNSIARHPPGSCLKDQAESSSTSESPPFDDNLQDCDADTFLQECGPDVLLGTNVLASQSSLSSSQNFSRSSTSTIYELSSPLRTGGHSTKQEPKTSITDGPWYSKVFHGPEEAKSCERPRIQKAKPAGTRPSQGQNLNSPAQVRKARSARKNSSLSASEKEQHPPEIHFGNRIKNFFMALFSSKAKSQADCQQNPKIQSANTKKQDLSTSRTLRQSGVPEAQMLMSTVGRILEEKLGLPQEPSASKKTLHEVPAPTAGYSHHHLAPPYPQQSQVKNTRASFPQTSPIGPRHPVHESRVSHYHHPGTDLPPRKPVSLISHACQHRPKGMNVSGQRIHCPRHCRLSRLMVSHACHAAHLVPCEVHFSHEKLQPVHRKPVFCV